MTHFGWSCPALADHVLVTASGGGWFVGAFVVNDLSDGNATPAAAPAITARKDSRIWIALGVLAALLVGFNLSVWWPCASELSKDGRNSGARLHVYRSWLVSPTDITIDIVSIDAASTADLTRQLFQIATALQGRKFSNVTLARAGKPVFLLNGEHFSIIGEEFAAGQNPVYLIRTLPEQLALPNGQQAFGSWEGGWLGVSLQQMKDVNDFGKSWAAGSLITSEATP